jgi:hypothetical protein
LNHNAQSRSQFRSPQKIQHSQLTPGAISDNGRSLELNRKLRILPLLHPVLLPRELSGFLPILCLNSRVQSIISATGTRGRHATPMSRETASTSAETTVLSNRVPRWNKKQNLRTAGYAPQYHQVRARPLAMGVALRTRARHRHASRSRFAQLAAAARDPGRVRGRKILVSARWALAAVAPRGRTMVATQACPRQPWRCDRGLGRAAGGARCAAEISAKLKREEKAAKARDRGSRQGPNQR